MQSTAFKHTIGKKIKIKNLFPRPISLVRKTTEAKQLQFTSIIQIDRTLVIQSKCSFLLSNCSCGD